MAQGCLRCGIIVVQQHRILSLQLLTPLAAQWLVGRKVGVVGSQVIAAAGMLRLDCGMLSLQLRLLLLQLRNASGLEIAAALRAFHVCEREEGRGGGEEENWNAVGEVTATRITMLLLLFVAFAHIWPATRFRDQLSWSWS